MNTNIEQIRDAAIGHHHIMAPTFESWYEGMARSRFSNAFAYGRYKIDVMLDAELKTLKPGARVLDIGCGTGVYLQRFAELGFTPVGIEPAAAMLERARNSNPTCEIHQGVSTALPVPDASFDAVTAIEVFRYLHPKDIDASLAEIYRVLKPDGFVFFTMVNRWALDGYWVLQRARQLLLRSAFDQKHPHCEFFTPSQVEAVLRRAGFVEGRAHGRMLAAIRFAYRLGNPVGARVARILEPLDDTLHSSTRFLDPFAGHLVGVAHKPA